MRLTFCLYLSRFSSSNTMSRPLSVPSALDTTTLSSWLSPTQTSTASVVARPRLTAPSTSLPMAARRFSAVTTLKERLLSFFACPIYPPTLFPSLHVQLHIPKSSIKKILSSPSKKLALVAMSLFGGNLGDYVIRRGSDLFCVKKGGFLSVPLSVVVIVFFFCFLFASLHPLSPSPQ